MINPIFVEFFEQVIAPRIGAPDLISVLDALDRGEDPDAEDEDDD